MHLYLHIPFCAKKCAYCDFVSYAGRDKLMEPYVGALLRQMRASEYKGAGLDSIFFGGGTPALLPEGAVARILDEARLDFAPAPDAEISLEANPGALTRAKLDEYARSGVNRLSLGVQSMDDGLLRRIGRIHTASQAAGALILARDAGFENVNADLMFGLPGQTLKLFRETLLRILDFHPAHLSLYALILEERTPLWRQKPALPGEDETADMYDLCREMLAENGYEHYEISNFARPGFACRHNLNTWRYGEYLGLGVAAHSFIGGTRFAVPDSLTDYIEGNCRIERQAVSPGEAVFERLMLGLRLKEGVPRRALPDTRKMQEALERMRASGLLERDRDRVRPTERGMALQNPLLFELQDALDGG